MIQLFLSQIRIRESKEFRNAVDRILKRGNASVVLGATTWWDKQNTINFNLKQQSACDLNGKFSKKLKELNQSYIHKLFTNGDKVYVFKFLRE
jgi:hypothetical protein